MFTVSRPTPNRLDIAISGEIDANEMEIGVSELLALSEGIENGQMLYTINNLALPTIGALTVEFQHLPGLLRLLGRFDRCAVVADQGWLRTAAEVEGALIPGLEIKAFKPSALGNAEAWLSAA